MVRRAVRGVLERLRSAPEPTLLGRIVLTFLVVSTFFALLLHSNQVIFIASAILATVLLSYLLTCFSIAPLAVRRRLPERVVAGEPFDVRLRVRNTSAWRPALGLGFLDALQVSEAGGVTRGPTLPVLPPGRSVEIDYVKRIHRRGIYTIVNTMAATRFPFGIFERRVLAKSAARLVVLPSLGRLHGGARRVLARRIAVPRALRRACEGNEEFHSLREYRPGDNPRHIHWRTSARVGKLVRRVMREEATEALTILLDTCVDGIDAEARKGNLEKAVSCAATLLVDAAQRGRGATVRFAGGTASHSGHARGLVPALETLAGLEASRTPPARLVEAIVDPMGSAILISLGGAAVEARRQAASRGIHLHVWDVADPSFARYFAKR